MAAAASVTSYGLKEGTGDPSSGYVLKLCPTELRVERRWKPTSDKTMNALKDLSHVSHGVNEKTRKNLEELLQEKPPQAKEWVPTCKGSEVQRVHSQKHPVHGEGRKHELQRGVNSSPLPPPLHR